MKTLFARICILSAAAFAVSAHAADIKHGADLVNKGGCAGCHGAGLDKPVTPDYPIIAGQPESYVYRALQQYQTAHQNPIFGRNNPIMGGVVGQFSDADLQDIAAYVASLKGPLYAPDKARSVSP